MPSGGHNKTPLVWNDKDFESINDMARKVKVSAHKIRTNLENGKPLKGHCVDIKIT